MAVLKYAATALALVTFLSMPSGLAAAVLDKVVAYVDEEPITLRELDSAHERAQAEGLVLSRREVLDTLIDRLLILHEARRLRIAADDDDELIEEYLNLKITGFVVVDEEEIARYYDENREMFDGRVLADVHGDIEKALVGRERKRRLVDLLRELRGKAVVKTFMDGVE